MIIPCFLDIKFADMWLVLLEHVTIINTTFWVWFVCAGDAHSSVSQPATEAAEGHGAAQASGPGHATHHGWRQTQEVSVLGHAAGAQTWWVCQFRETYHVPKLGWVSVSGNIPCARGFCNFWDTQPMPKLLESVSSGRHSWCQNCNFWDTQPVTKICKYQFRDI